MASKTRNRMEIQADAEVYGPDGLLGSIEYLLVNPANDTVTDLVVKTTANPKSEQIVPIRYLVPSDESRVRISLDRDRLHRLDRFVDTDYLVVDFPDEYTSGPVLLHPYLIPDRRLVTVKTKHIPPGELPVHPTPTVRATDGKIGRVDEFLIEPDSGHITHLVLREGHLWGKRDVMVPVSAIRSIEDDLVQLSLSKDAVEALPPIATRARSWSIRSRTETHDGHP